MAQGEQNKMVQGGPTAKNTLQTAEWVPNQGLPVRKSFEKGQNKTIFRISFETKRIFYELSVI